MPHLVILYTGQLDAEVNMTTLCRQMADAMLTVKDEEGKQVFPTGGTRVLAYPAPHYAVADGGAAGLAAGGTGDYAFVYLNVRMGRGRSDATQQGAGQTLLEVAKAFLGEMAHILNAIFSALLQRESPYAVVLAAVLELAGHRAQAVQIVADEALDESWREPEAFDGCSTRGQARPGEAQPIHIVRKTSTQTRGVAA